MVLFRKDDRLAAVQQNATVQMIAHGASEYTPFNIAPLAYQTLRRIKMAYTLHILLNDRALIEIAGDVVGGGADQLYATIERLMVGLCALEARQERVVDVDAPAEEIRRQFIGEHLHVTGKNDQISASLFDYATQLPFLLGLRLAGNRQVPERKITQHDVAVDFARIVGDDAHHIHGKLARSPAIKKINQAVIKARDENEHLAVLGLVAQGPGHVEALHHGSQGRLGRLYLERCGTLEHDPVEVSAGERVAELLKVLDVTTQMINRG